MADDAPPTVRRRRATTADTAGGGRVSAAASATTATATEAAAATVATSASEPSPGLIPVLRPQGFQLSPVQGLQVVLQYVLGGLEGTRWMGLAGSRGSGGGSLGGKDWRHPRQSLRRARVAPGCPPDGAVSCASAAAC